MKRYLKDTGGNVAIMFAACIGILGMGASMAVDLSRAVDARSHLQSAADAAALNGAIAFSDKNADRKTSARASLESNLQTFPNSEAIAKAATIAFDDAARTSSVSLSYRVPSLFGFGVGDWMDVSVASTAAYPDYTVQPVSAVLVLDVSSSMEDMDGFGMRKLDALKASVQVLVDELESNAKDRKEATTAIRTAMVAYDANVVTSSPFEGGWDRMNSDVQALVTGAGTDSSMGLTWAEPALTSDRAYRTATLNGTAVAEYVVLITDGDNYSAQRDADSKASCDRMKAQGVTVYAVSVAAPPEGKMMLQSCATQWSTDPAMTMEERVEGYMFDASNTTELKAAFEHIGKSLMENGARLTR